MWHLLPHLFYTCPLPPLHGIVQPVKGKEVMAILVKLIIKFAFLAFIAGIMAYLMLSYMVPYMHT